MDKIPHWVWIAAGGGLLLMLLLSGGSSSSTPAVSTLTPGPVPDTSAQDTATIEGKYGLAGLLLNAAGALDVAGISANAQASHDYFGLQGLALSNAGNLDAIRANYAGQNTLLNTQGKFAVQLDTIDQGANVTINQSNNDAAVTINGQNVSLGMKQSQDQKETAFSTNNANAAIGQAQANRDVAINQSNNATAQTINEKTQEQQTKRNAWSAGASVVGTALSVAAFFL